MTTSKISLLPIEQSYSNVVSNLKLIKEHQEEISNHLIHLRNDFFNAVCKGDIARVQQLLDWGIEQYDDMLIGTENNKKFNNGYKAILLNQEMRDFFLVQCQNKFTPIFKQIFYKQVESVLKIDDLQWILINLPQDFNQQFLRKTIQHWCSIVFDEKKHKIIHEHIQKQAINPATLFYNISSSSFKTLEDFCSIPFYKNIIDNLTKSSFNEIANECLASSIRQCNQKNINFWLNYHVTFPEDKKTYADIVVKSHQFKDLSTLDLILKHVDITIGEHVMLKTAIHSQFNEVVDFLISKYSMKDFETIDKVFNKRVDTSFVLDVKNKCEQAKLYLHLDQTLSDTISLSSKLKI